MSGFEAVMVSYVLNSLWQAPLVFAAAWLAARLMRKAGPPMEHRVWVSALVLECVLPALSILPWEKMHLMLPGHAQIAGDGRVSVQVGAGAAVSAWRLPAEAVGALAILYAAVTLYMVARFVWRSVRVAQLKRGAEPLEATSDVAITCERWRERLGIARPVAVVQSAEIFAPVTMGFVSGSVMLPAGMAERMSLSEVNTAIGHELAHVQRNDFVKNLAYEFLTLPVAYHPCLWLTRQSMTETREMVCDAMAAGVSGSEEYAQSLLRLAGLLLQGRPVRVPHAIGVFDANTLERRLMKLTENKGKASRLRAASGVALCIALGAATAVSAVALRVGVNAPEGVNSQAQSKDAPKSIAPKVMQGNLISKVAPKYPPSAKAARIQGTVELDAVIDKSGRVDSLHALSGPNELQQSALDAVRLWRYKPFLLNGKPIEVETTISVVYSLVQ